MPDNILLCPNSAYLSLGNSFNLKCPIFVSHVIITDAEERGVEGISLLLQE